MSIEESAMWDFKIVGSVMIGPKGQVVIPKAAREDMWIASWDSLICISKWWKWIILIKADTVLEFIDYVKSEVEVEKNKSKNIKNKD